MEIAQIAGMIIGTIIGTIVGIALAFRAIHK